VREVPEVVEGAARDPVSNVRLTLARELPRGSPALDALRKDQDPDVAFFAGRT
jgi:hypothetical protein